MRFRFFPLLVALCLVTAPLAAAPSKKSRDEVVRLVSRSARHYEAGRFDQAIELLQRAYAIEPDPTILYNLARAYEGKGELQRAVEAYRKYLDDAPKARDRGSVQHRITTLEVQIREKAVLERERDLAVRRALEARRRAARAEEEEKSAPPAGKPSVVPWIVAAIGAAVVGSGVYFGVHAHSLHGDAESAALARDAADLNSRAKTYALLANVSFAVGGAAVVGGVSWGVVAQSSSGAPTTARGITIRGRF